jgi:hypothetical protein
MTPNTHNPYSTQYAISHLVRTKPFWNNLQHGRLNEKIGKPNNLKFFEPTKPKGLNSIAKWVIITNELCV